MYQIKYNLKFETMEDIDLICEFDSKTSDIIPKERDQWPAWTSLDHHRCPHCPFQKETTPRCPLAISLVEIIEAAGKVVSHEQVEATAFLPNRTVTLKTTAQRALRSVVGLLISTSGCPHAAYFKPMARFHLPFSGTDETWYRIASMFALARQLQNGLNPDADDGTDGFALMEETYRNMNQVNEYMAERLRTVCSKDSMLNALVLLDVFAQMLPMRVEELKKEMLPYFKAFLDS